jgi:hypothetical protein
MLWRAILLTDLMAWRPTTRARANGFPDVPDVRSCKRLIREPYPRPITAAQYYDRGRQS